MNSSWATQTQGERRKKNYRELDHHAKALMREQRLQQKGEETRAQVEERIRNRILNQPLCSDALLSLFSSSLFSYRKASVCEPFPTNFINEGERNYDTAELYTKSLPSIQHFVSKDAAISNLPLPALQLLAWIVDTEHYDELYLTQVSLDQYKQETKGIDAKQSKFSDPNFIFKIEYTENHPQTEAFDKLKEKYSTTLGFHGSALENFHSIIRNGLDATFGKETSLFGDGIYLSEDRDVAYNFLKFGKNWSQNSAIGSQVGCIVCGEVIKHPKHVRISDETQTKSISITDDDAKLPKGYIVVEDNVCVRVKYLLVYKTSETVSKSKTSVCQLVAIIYIGLLFLLWITRSSHVKLYYSQLLDRM